MCWILAASARAGEARRPNIIFILADDIGISGFGCYEGQHETPHIDALARSGIRFEYCFSAPLCGPSRAQSLTGRYGFRTGVVGNSTGGKARPEKETCIAKLLRDAGYATAVAGKWRQLEYLTSREEALRWGFDEFLVWYDKAAGERYWSPHYNKNGRILSGVEKSYGPDLLHEFIADFMTRHRDQPFFVYYPMVLVHAPILRTPDSASGKKDALFKDNMAYMDKLVGKLVSELERLKLLESTLIVFTGDNGTVGGGTVSGKRIDGGKGSMREGGSRVPLIASWKGTVPAGRTCADLTDFSDFFPTFAEVAGASIPKGLHVDGRSFAPQLRGEAGRPRDWIYVQLEGEFYVRDSRWKLYGNKKLCDMKEAPYGEEVVSPEAQGEEAAAARKRLQAVLDGLRGPTASP